jgi:ubiquinone/menaquinone biosynthesis C-methylase UbiE
MVLLRRFVAGRALKLKQSGTACDIGCGSGSLVMELARRSENLSVIGVDLSEQMFRRVRSAVRKKKLNNRVSFLRGDAKNLPFDNDSLDLVVSTLSLHHWSDPVGVFKDIARVLRPGGAFMIFDLRRDMTPPASLFLWFLTRCIVPRALKNINEPLGSRNAAYTPDETASLLARSGYIASRISSGLFWISIEGTVHKG